MRTCEIISCEMAWTWQQYHKVNGHHLDNGTQGWCVWVWADRYWNINCLTSTWFDRMMTGENIFKQILLFLLLLLLLHWKKNCTWHESFICWAWFPEGRIVLCICYLFMFCGPWKQICVRVGVSAGNLFSTIIIRKLW